MQYGGLDALGGLSLRGRYDHDRYNDRYDDRYDDRYNDRYNDRYDDRYDGYGRFHHCRLYHGRLHRLSLLERDEPVRPPVGLVCGPVS